MNPRQIRTIMVIVVLIILVLIYLYPSKKIPLNTTIDKLIVLKSKRELLAYSKGKLIKTYSIALGRNPIGDKQFKGDNRTPEGKYIINDKNPNSAYHKNLGISYPNNKDRQKAKKSNKSPGGDIKIHGLKNAGDIISNFHHWTDWTLGCIAVTNEEIDELYNAVPMGTIILIQK